MTNTTFTQISESGSGRPVLLLHGGGGPFTVASLAAHLAESAHVIAPTHPGFNGTERPANIDSVKALAAEYAQYIADADLRDVLVVGSSVGGWIAAEIALADTDGRVAGVVPINAAGFTVPGNPVRDISGMTPQELAQYSFHDPSKLRVPPPTPEGLAIAKANAATLAALSVDPEPTFLSRAGGITAPTLILWGESDRVVDLDYGRALAAAIPGAEFVVIPEAGHLPHLENPTAVFAALDAFALAHV